MVNVAEETEQKVKEIEVRMLKENLDTNLISQVTGLHNDQVMILKNKLKLNTIKV